MKLGYACLNTQLEGFKTMTVKKASQLSDVKRFEELQKKTRQNFSNLYDIMKWNVENDIHLYRVSSNLCPLHTHDICNYDYREDFCVLDLCAKIKTMAEDNNIKLSTHPSQYNVVNSTREEVFQKTLVELQHHYDFMQLLGISVMCLHVGGKAGGEEAGMERFIDNFARLPKHLQEVIYLENDDKSYNVENTLTLCETLEIPMIIDLHHDRCLKSSQSFDMYLNRIKNTWKGKTPKCHLSSGDKSEEDRSHASSITEKDFICFSTIVDDFDIMFECKDKQESVLKMRELII